MLTQTSNPSASTAFENAKEQSELPDKANQEIQLADAVPSASSQVNLDFQSFLLKEVAFIEAAEVQKSSVDLFVSSAQKALRVLLQKIISPNAP